ncbi:MAG: L-sorbosone dehydrogenase [uncultured bacterium]|nr:MAG: L-sorbosone dehydrogenase [uncultured bacterium]
MKKNLYLTGIFVAVVILLWVGIFLWKNLRGSAPAFFAPEENIADLLPSSEEESKAKNEAPKDGENRTDFPLKLPEGFRISVFAKNLTGARVMIFDSFGNMWVSRSSEDVVTQLEIQDGKVVRQNDVLVGLNNPHGLALDPDQPSLLYIGEENKITKIALYSDGGYEKIADLPSGGGHSTRTLLFGPDKKLYVSSGSSCNVCVEKDARRATIYSLNRDGSDFREFSGGLRNSVFMTINPRTNEIWATEMGRDLLGDNIPPDEINIISEGKNYGWPYCYGKKVHDSNFDPTGAKIEFCRTAQSSLIDVPAHSAPLGLTFLSNSKLPEEYRNDLLVSYHGSWNRSTPTGYKVVRHKFDEQGNYEGVEDFITGWLTGENALGRPVDILESKDGRIYISDDKAGIIYLVEHVGE